MNLISNTKQKLRFTDAGNNLWLLKGKQKEEG